MRFLCSVIVGVLHDPFNSNQVISGQTHIIVGSWMTKSVEVIMTKGEVVWQSPASFECSPPE